MMNTVGKMDMFTFPGTNCGKAVGRIALNYEDDWNGLTQHPGCVNFNDWVDPVETTLTHLPGAATFIHVLEHQSIIWLVEEFRSS